MLCISTSVIANCVFIKYFKLKRRQKKLFTNDFKYIIKSNSKEIVLFYITFNNTSLTACDFSVSSKENVTVK